ncbi:MAG: septum site-determining protein MinD [Firmicutes bacterium]|nr:septum site-determining protein MinD [Candidatus Caballimonas caccae]
MAKKIVITSGKGGVGKTTVSANLGKALANMGLRVALIDIDFGLNNLDVVMGLENKVVYDIFDVLDGRCRVKQALVCDKERNNLYILPSNSGKYNQNVNGQNVKLIVESISSVFDYIILDCPAGIDCGFHRAVSCVDEAIVVATPNIPSLRDADKVISILKTYQLKSIGLVINRARGDLIVSDKMMMPYEIENMLKTELIGVLPEEDLVFLSCGNDLPKNSDSYKGYKLLAQNIHNGKSKIFDVTSKYSGIIGSIRRGLKKSV